MEDKTEAFYRCDHEWEPFLADGRVPYNFCRKCKSTLMQGMVRPLRAFPTHKKYGEGQ